MITLFRLLLFVAIACLVVLAQSNEQDAKKSDQQSAPAKVQCPNKGRNAGYTVHLPQTPTEVHIYDVDTAGEEDPKHDAICLNVVSGDRMLWWSRSGSAFRLQIKRAPGYPASCGQHPFKNNPPSTPVNDYTSGPARTDSKNCLYEVDFPKGDQKAADPHIYTYGP
jgi:hypothetical protein